MRQAQSARLRTSRLYVALAALSFLVGCASSWTVKKESGPPAALRGVKAVALSFDYQGLMVSGMGGDKPEAKWVAEKAAEEDGYVATWSELKRSWESHFIEGISATCPVKVTLVAPGTQLTEETASLTVRLSRLQLGRWIPMSGQPSIVDATHTWSRGGEVVDEIETRAVAAATIYSPSITKHISGLGESSGEKSGNFLASKQ